MTTTSPVRELTLSVPQADLDDLADRLARTRLPNRAPGGPRVEGDVDPDLVARLLARWRDGFDWRAVEARVNAVPQVVVDVDGLGVHALHARAEAPGGLPVLLLHGWPDSFLRYLDVVPRLVAAGHDVVVPSLPGHGLSDQPASADLTSGAEAVHRVMVALGHERYAVHGGDWGSGVADALVTGHPEAVAALHLTDVPLGRSFGVDVAATEGAERAFLEGIEAWGDQAVYFDAAARQPLALAHGLSDSPVGLLAWIGEKYAAWTDRDLCDDAALDQVLAQVSLTWFTGTAWSAMRCYSEAFEGWDDVGDDDRGDDAGWSGGRVEVPTAFALFPADIGVAPREHAERFFDVQRYTLMPQGGHFGALEHPGPLADDLVAFLADRV